VLLAVQPLFASMDPKAQQSIWWGAALIGAAAAGVSLFAHRQGRGPRRNEPSPTAGAPSGE
jgi:hypothetical protein